MGSIESIRGRLLAGLVIPACPLALTAARKLDERRQRGLFRYYLAAGAGGLAVGVHTTQFAIRDPKVGLLKPVLDLAAAVMDEHVPDPGPAPVRVAGICGLTRQAVTEAQGAREAGYEAGLVSLAAMAHAGDDDLLRHCREIASVLPLFGFYLQPAAGGRPLSFAFWRRWVEIEDVVAIKIAPFDRYRTIDVLRAVAESGRTDLALYTGNDDAIVSDLVTPWRFQVQGKPVEARIVGGLLGHWAVWTRAAVALHRECRRIGGSGADVPAELLRRAVEVTDANAAVFDAANRYSGCIAGIHEVLRRQGLLEGVWCLDPAEQLSPGQAEEIDRVSGAYPHLIDDAFVAANRDEWMR